MTDYDSLHGWLHLGTAIAALCLGGLILFLRKGNQLHKRLGQGYIAAMGVMLTTAFMIYRLSGEFNIFHYAAVAASLTLAAGILPLYFMTSRPDRIEFHKRFMYWSVVGLYMAFAAETLTRIPSAPFMPMVYLGSGLVLGIGILSYKKVIT